MQETGPTSGAPWWRLPILAFTLLTVSCGGLNGSTPLMMAAQNGEVLVVQALLDRSVDLDSTNNSGWTALMFAAREGHASVVDQLLDAGAAPNLESQRITGNTMAPYPQTTALREALDSGHLDIARSLLERGANVDATAFAIAGGIDDWSLLEEMMERGGDPNEPSPIGYFPSPLCVASNKGNIAGVKWLIGKGADADGPRDLAVPDAVRELISSRCHPILGAIHHSHRDVLEVLLRHGADPNIVAVPDQRTPLLHYVVRHTQWDRYDENLEILRLLLSHDADPNYRAARKYPFNSRTPAEFVRDYRDSLKAKEGHAASIRKLNEIVKWLRQAGSASSANQTNG
tara:strand:+ start:206 stop:1237 length:1032 start_codon:yes stop_codon:yes gene_type:complete